MSSDVTREYMTGYLTHIVNEQAPSTTAAVVEFLKWVNEIPSALTDKTGIKIQQFAINENNWAHLMVQNAMAFIQAQAIAGVIRKFSL